jgi:hypothetical protein
MEMHVRRRATRSWRQRPFDNQDDLALGIAHSAHPQDLSRAPVLELQEAIHQFPQMFRNGPFLGIEKVQINS